MNNKVELIGWYGGDRAIARAAWTSTQIDVNLKTDEQIRDLLVNKLWNNGSDKSHKTPFERGIIEFNVTCEQASHIHLLKHRLANTNGESARYKELKEDKIYLPEDWNSLNLSDEACESLYNISGKSLNYEKTNTWNDVLKDYSNLGNFLYHECLKDIAPTVGRKRAKESARFFKTMNNQITLSVMMNMSCFHNFYTLRADDAAQKEIQYIANMVLDCIKNIPENPFKYTLEAFNLTKE